MENEQIQRSLPRGYRLEEYEIERELGQGGFGITYLAKDLKLKRHVVIKENFPMFAHRDPGTSRVLPNSKAGDDFHRFEWSRENFLKEAQMLARFDHPNIVKILRIFESNGTAYFVMPYVKGQTLGARIRDVKKQQGTGCLAESEIRSYLLPLLDGLRELHEQATFHRDIKPDNILLTKSGPVLIDFGAARQLQGNQSMTLIESPGYTPFEQLQSKGNIGPWSDIYALGGSLYTATSGESPPRSTDRIREASGQKSTIHEDLAKSGNYSDQFIQSVQIAMAFDPENRFQTCKEWEGYLEGKEVSKQIPVGGGQGQPLPKPPEDGKSSAMPKTILIGILGLLAVGGLFYLLANPPGASETPKAGDVNLDTSKTVGFVKYPAVVDESSSNADRGNLESPTVPDAEAESLKKEIERLRKEALEKELEKLKRDKEALLKEQQRVAKARAEAEARKVPATPWIFPNSNSRYLTDVEINALPVFKRWEARNEIFARRGYIFSTPKGQAFAKRLGSFYSPSSGNQDYIYSKMNSYEKANIEKIKEYE